MRRRKNYRQNWFRRRRRDFNDLYDMLARRLVKRASTRCRIDIDDVVKKAIRRRYFDIFVFFCERLVDFEKLLNASSRRQFAFDNALFVTILKWETREIVINLIDREIVFSNIFASLTTFLIVWFVVAFMQLFNAIKATLKLTDIVPDDVKSRETWLDLSCIFLICRCSVILFWDFSSIFMSSMTSAFIFLMTYDVASIVLAMSSLSVTCIVRWICLSTMRSSNISRIVTEDVDMRRSNRFSKDNKDSFMKLTPDSIFAYMKVLFVLLSNNFFWNVT